MTQINLKLRVIFIPPKIHNFSTMHALNLNFPLNKSACEIFFISFHAKLWNANMDHVEPSASRSMYKKRLKNKHRSMYLV